MKGFVFLDVLFASFFCIIALLIGLQLIGNVLSSSNAKFESLEIAALDISNRLTRTCYDFGGVAYCDNDYVRVGTIDEKIIRDGYTFSEDILNYSQASNVSFKVGIDNDQKQGVVCIIRLLKVHNSSHEARLQVCAE